MWFIFSLLVLFLLSCSLKFFLDFCSNFFEMVYIFLLGKSIPETLQTADDRFSESLQIYLINNYILQNMAKNNLNFYKLTCGVTDKSFDNLSARRQGSRVRTRSFLFLVRRTVRLRRWAGRKRMRSWAGAARRRRKTGRRIRNGYETEERWSKLKIWLNGNRHLFGTTWWEKLKIAQPPNS